MNFRSSLLLFLAGTLSFFLVKGQTVDLPTDTLLQTRDRQMAMWEGEFFWSLGDSLGVGGLRTATWINQQFWVPSAQTDSIYLLANDGSLQQIIQITGASGQPGFTSFTHDGTLIYGVSQGDLITLIDPQLQMMSGQISLPQGTNALFLTYDPGLDNGNGGFHIGTAIGNVILQFSLSGSPLGQIDASAHTRTGLSGLTFDNISQGGPYLWTFSQEGFPSNVVISQLQLPLGTFTGVQRDVQPDLLTPNAISADLWLIPHFPPLGHALLGGVSQGSSNQLFAYELNFQPQSNDIALTNCLPLPALTQVPLSQAAPFQFRASLLNLGTDTAFQGLLDVEIQDPMGATLYQAQTSWAFLTPTERDSFVWGNWSPPPLSGTYRVNIWQTLLGQTDPAPGNDSCQFFLSLNDSVFARDNNLIEQALGIGPDSNDQAVLGQNFPLQQTDFCTSVSMQLVRPPVGEVVSASIYEVLPNGKPSNLLGTTVEYVIQPQDALDTLWLTLAFPSAPLGLPPGDFFVGVNETGKKIELAASSQLFAPRQSWINWATSPFGDWTPLETLGFPVSFHLRPNFGPCAPAYLGGQIQIENDDSGNGDAQLSVQALGGFPPYTYQWDDPNNQTTPLAQGLAGGRPYQCLITDQNGCQLSLRSDTVTQWTTALDPTITSPLQVFPNPSQSLVFLQIPADAQGPLTLELFTPQGKRVHSLPINAIPHTSVRLDLTSFPSGIYFLRLKNDHQQWRQTLSLIR